MTLKILHEELCELSIVSSKTLAQLINAKKIADNHHTIHESGSALIVDKSLLMFERSIGPINESHDALIKLVGDDIAPILMGSLTKVDSLKDELSKLSTDEDIQYRLSVKKCEFQTLVKEKEDYEKEIKWIEENKGTIDELISLNATKEEVNNAPLPGLMSKVFNGRTKKVQTLVQELNHSYSKDCSPFISADIDDKLNIFTEMLINNENTRSHLDDGIGIAAVDIAFITSELENKRSLLSNIAYQTNNTSLVLSKIKASILDSENMYFVERLLGEKDAQKYTYTIGKKRLLTSHKNYFSLAINEVRDLQVKLRWNLSLLDKSFDILENKECPADLLNEMDTTKEQLVNIHEVAKKYFDIALLAYDYEFISNESYTIRDVVEMISNHIARMDMGYKFDTGELTLYKEMPMITEYIDSSLIK